MGNEEIDKLKAERKMLLGIVQHLLYAIRAILPEVVAPQEQVDDVENMLSTLEKTLNSFEDRE